MLRDAHGLPSWLYWSEPARACADYGLFLAAAPWMAQLPRGDGHPVLVLPGLLADDDSTAVLRAVLQRLDYKAEGWTLGRNVGPSDASVRAMRSQLRRMSDSHGTSVSVIGCSLGGLYARDLARALPGAVRQVITLGTPLRLGGQRRPRSGRERWGRAVPSTSIYS